MDILRIDGWLQGLKAALQAYARASHDASPEVAAPSVLAWALLIAAGLVLLEWLLAPGDRGAARGELR